MRWKRDAVLRCNDGYALREAAIAGAGLLMQPEVLLADALASGGGARAGGVDSAAAACASVPAPVVGLPKLTRFAPPSAGNGRRADNDPRVGTNHSARSACQSAIESLGSSGHRQADQLRCITVARRFSSGIEAWVMLKGTAHQTLHAAEALRKRKPAQLADDALGVTFIALHTTEIGLPPGRSLFAGAPADDAGVQRKPDSLHFRLLFQPFGELQRVRAVALHPQREVRMPRSVLRKLLNGSSTPPTAFCR